MQTNVIKKGSRKGLLSRLLVIMLSVMIIMPTMPTATASAATDLSNKVTVNDFSIVSTDNPDGIPTLKKVDENNPKDTNPDNYATGFSTHSISKIKVDFHIDMGNGLTAAGDTLTIPLSTNNFMYATTEFTPLYDVNNVKIGTWKLSSGKIEMTISEGGAGKSSILGSMTTGDAFRMGSVVASEKVDSISIGNMTKSYKINKSEKSLSGNFLFKFTENASDNIVRWGIVQGDQFANQLLASDGKNIEDIGDYILTDQLPSGCIDVSINRIEVVIPYIISTTDKRAATANGEGAGRVNVSDRFDRVEQNSGETLTQFKTRVTALKYGVYEDNNEILTIIINFGDFSKLNYQLKYKDLFDMEPGAKAAESDFCFQGEDTIINTGLGSTNVVGGNAVSFVAYIDSKFNQVVTDTEISNTATAAHSGTTESFSATATLKPAKGTATAGDPGSAKLVKFEKGSNSAIKDAKFKLQKQNGSGGWEDYTASGNEQIKATDAEGTVEFTNLNNGTYRFVETEAAEGYDKDSVKYDKETFTIAEGDTAGQILSATNKKLAYDVNFDMQGHGTQVDPQNDIPYGNTVTKPADPSEVGYVFGGWYKEAACTNEYDFSTPVKSSYTLYAKWTEKTYTVKYDLNGGKVGNASTVSDKTGVAFDASGLLYATNPAKDGYTFTGWKLKDTTTDVTNSDKYTALVNGDRNVSSVTLVAQYRKNVTIGGNGSADLKVTKALTGTEAKVDQNFAFTMTDGAVTGAAAGVTAPTAPSSVNISTEKGTDTATQVYGLAVGTNKSICFGEITFTQPGTYTYKVSETPGANTINYEYDKSNYTITIVVSESQDKSKLEAAVSYKNGDAEAAGLNFTNKYKAASSDAFMIPTITKTVTGDVPKGTDKDFAFAIEGEGKAPMPNDTTKSRTGSGTVDFGSVTFTEAGSYTYTIKETKGNDGGYNYDPSIYTIKVKVEDVKGKLTVTESTTTYERDEVKDANGNVALEAVTAGTNADAVTFTNPYAAKYTTDDDMLKVDPPVKKTVKGNPAKDETFRFALVAIDAENPMPEGSENGIKEATVKGSGETEFGTWIYTKAGTYTYGVGEVDTQIKGYKYDTSVYTIIDEVTDEDGQLVLNRTVLNEKGIEVSSCDFVNTYTSASAVKTGDNNTMIWLMSILAALALAAAGAFVFIRRKRA